MASETHKVKYTGKIREITLGTGPKAVTVGGATSYPFHLFEGTMPRRPAIAMEVPDQKPEDWAAAAVEPFADVLGDPAEWAKKNVAEYGAEMIALQMGSIDPNGENRPAREAADIAKKVIAAVDVPVILWGSANHEKDTEVLRLIAEECDGKNLALGPVEEGDYKQIGAGALAYKHTVIASSPIDVNLAKQLNILSGNLACRERSSWTRQRARWATALSIPTGHGAGPHGALTQEDEAQHPIVCNIGTEV